MGIADFSFLARHAHNYLIVQIIKKQEVNSRKNQNITLHLDFLF